MYDWFPNNECVQGAEIDDSTCKVRNQDKQNGIYFIIAPRSSPSGIWSNLKRYRED